MTKEVCGRPLEIEFVYPRSIAPAPGRITVTGKQYRDGRKPYNMVYVVDDWRDEGAIQEALDKIEPDFKHWLEHGDEEDGDVFSRNGWK